MTEDLNKNQPDSPIPSDTPAPASTVPPRHALSRLAVFLDLDGTLAPIAATPDQAAIPQSTLDLLGRLCQACAGSVAVVSGRDGTDIERLIAPLQLPYAALHGAQLKTTPRGAVQAIAIRREELAGITTFIERKVLHLSGIIIEHKALSLALHYRNAPRYADEMHRLALSALAGRSGDFEVQEGKMVVEIKPRGVSKGAAIEHFMGLPPFQGRVPLFAGDDLTDESAFGRVNARQGISIKIGSGPTQARWRLDDPPALSAWLGSLLTTADTATAAVYAIKTKDGK